MQGQTITSKPSEIFAYFVGAEMDSLRQRRAQREFLKKIKEVNIDDKKSLAEFKSFMDYFNIVPIVLGKMGGSHILQFIPDGDILNPDYEFLEEGCFDVREEVTTMVLGMYHTREEFIIGRYLDEGRTGPVAPLEVFLQLGKIYACEVTPKRKTSEFEMWYETNYVLIMNLEDDSIWVIRKKYMMDEQTSRLELASQVEPDEWDKFPGFDDTPVVFGRLAASFDSLEAGVETELHLSYVQKPRDYCREPVLVLARRTPDGGIRRTNDYLYLEKMNPEVAML